MKNIKNKLGQSSIEFILTFLFILGFVFSFYKLSIVYTNGYLLHYATFMASRAYLVFDNNSNTPQGADGPALTRAKKVLQEFPLKEMMPGYPADLQVNSPQKSDLNRKLLVGVFTEVKQKIIPPTTIMGSAMVNFRSESFLGREPTRTECLKQVCQAIIKVGGDCKHHATLFDNGC